MKKLIFGLLFLGTCSAFAQSAGNGSSGGGNIFGDQLNPWFLINTQQVNYCVQISDEFSQLPDERIFGIIEESFSFWKRSLSKYDAYNIPTSDWSEVRGTLGTQEFIRQSECNSKTDITFQMGVLSEKQKKEINYKQLIGLAQRTQYDFVNLRGKGFIYIAPENGLLRPASAKLHKTPWSLQNGEFLKFTLYHELGHIFGLQDDHYTDFGLMSAHFVDHITGKESGFARALYSFKEPSPLGCNQKLEGFSQMIGGFDSSDGFFELRDFLGLKDRFSIYLLSDSKGLKIQDTQTGKVYGEIVYTKNNQMDGSKENAISLYLTKEQRVYKNLSPKVLDTRIGLYPLVTAAALKDEVLSLENGNSLKVFVSFDKNCSPTIGGIFKDNLFFNLFFRY